MLTGESLRHCLPTFLLLVLLPGVAFGHCAVGPAPQSQRALQMAFEAQSAISEHQEVARLDRSSREILDATREEHRSIGQASLMLGTSGIGGFAVCDEVDWQPASLSNMVLSGGVGVGVPGAFRLELRALGVSDSVVQRELTGYYPARAPGARADVPGAAGAGHGLWSVRVELLDEVALTVGQVTSHAVSHSVGWDEESDEDGNTTLVRSHTRHWGNGTNGRVFVALGAPRFGGADLVVGGGELERVGVKTPPLVIRPRVPVALLELDGEFSGPIEPPAIGFAVTPLAGPFDDRRLPAFRVRGATELSSAVLREASVGARVSRTFADLGSELPGELWAVDVRTGLYGGDRLKQARHPVVPGASVTADVAIPIVAMMRLSAWGAVNRPAVIRAVPDAVGRPEWGVSVYASYAR